MQLFHMNPCRLCCSLLLISKNWTSSKLMKKWVGINTCSTVWGKYFATEKMLLFISSKTVCPMMSWRKVMKYWKLLCFQKKKRKRNFMHFIHVGLWIAVLRTITNIVNCKYVKYLFKRKLKIMSFVKSEKKPWCCHTI